MKKTTDCEFQILNIAHNSDLHARKIVIIYNTFLCTELLPKKLIIKILQTENNIR